MQFNPDGRQRRKPRGRKIPSESDRKYIEVTGEQNDAPIDAILSHPKSEAVVQTAAILNRIAESAEYQRGT